MTRALVLALFALFALSRSAAACEIGAGTILAIPSKDGRLLEVRDPSDGRESRACLEVANCRWEWTPSRTFLASIKRQEPDAEQCDARLAVVHDVDHVRRLMCPLSAPAARPFVFVSHVLAAQGSGQCSSAHATTTPDGVRAQANLRSGSLEYCVDLEWSFPNKSLLVSFAPTCDIFNVPGKVPASTVGIQVRQPKASMAFGVKPLQGQNWSLESVSTQPSTPYLSRWANAVRGLDVGRLTPPEDDHNHSTNPSTLQLSDLIGRWTLAMLLGGHNTDEDLAVRAWMGKLELGNYDKATNTLLRTECIEPTDVASCH